MEHQSQDSEKQRRRKHLHSQIERRRRDRMAVCYDRLRVLVPGLQNGIIPKLAILEKTVEYLESLEIPEMRSKMDLKEIVLKEHQ
jgi:Helix-loop-helix DNA-binding domain